MTYTGSGYTAAPIISFNGGGFINITANLTVNIMISFTITNGGTGFTSAPTNFISGLHSIPYLLTTCTISSGIINAVTLPATTYPFLTAPTISIFCGGNVTTTSTIGYQVNSIILPNIPYGTYMTQPIV